jgi:hypothetical protein
MDVDTLWIMEQNLGRPSHGDGKKITHVMFGSSLFSGERSRFKLYAASNSSSSKQFLNIVGYLLEKKN